MYHKIGTKTLQELINKFIWSPRFSFHFKEYEKVWSTEFECLVTIWHYADIFQCIWLCAMVFKKLIIWNLIIQSSIEVDRILEQKNIFSNRCILWNIILVIPLCAPTKKGIITDKVLVKLYVFVFTVKRWFITFYVCNHHISRP